MDYRYRTRVSYIQTSLHRILNALNTVCDVFTLLEDVEESSLLVEQDWGMFEGTGLVKGRILYEKEYEHLQVIFQRITARKGASRSITL
jgi:hypothetical protein